MFKFWFLLRVSGSIFLIMLWKIFCMLKLVWFFILLFWMWVNESSCFSKLWLCWIFCFIWISWVLVLVGKFWWVSCFICKERVVIGLCNLCDVFVIKCFCCWINLFVCFNKWLIFIINLWILFGIFFVGNGVRFCLWCFFSLWESLFMGFIVRWII